METKELLDKLDKVTKLLNKERGLYLLLKSQEDKIKGGIENDSTGEWFHKAFRQVDVTENVFLDAAIWNLLSDSVIFWKMLNGDYDNDLEILEKYKKL